MRKVIIFGMTQLAEIVYNFLKADGEVEVVGFTVDQCFLKETTYFDKPVVAFEKVEQIWSPEEYEMMICLGYTNMNKAREQKFAEARRKGYHLSGYVHPSAIVLTDNIGEGNFIMEGVVIGQECEIGEGNVIYPAAHVAHHTKVGNYNFFTISCAVAGNILIGNNCVFGNNCTIKNNITIGDYTLVGAAAYISHDTEPNSVYVPPRSYRLEGKESLDFKL